MEKAFLMQRALFQIFWSPALLFCLISIFACAQDFEVPDSWQKIAAAKDGEIVSVGIQDGWVVWMEKRLDPATAQHRAQSFFVGLYRMKLGTEHVETLLEPVVSRVWGDQYILGCNGIVSSNDRGDSQQVLFSVNPTERMLLCPEEERSSMLPGIMSEKSGQPKLIKVLGQSEYTPIRIYRDSLVCLGGGYGQKALVWVPFDGKKPDFERKQNIFGPTDAEIKDICVDKNMAVYSTDRSLTLYDIETQKIRLFSNKVG